MNIDDIYINVLNKMKTDFNEVCFYSNTQLINLISNTLKKCKKSSSNINDKAEIIIEIFDKIETDKIILCYNKHQYIKFFKVNISNIDKVIRKLKLTNIENDTI
jgi:hypothetical protein